ncbi:MAG: hypothetical protein KZQ65_11965 [Candidatus Thiodiazotropha sp. (ex Gloverina cf. vestifex)]|nr:hypothetical protein [Candidatus Thiodiazotropha sp. (ex Gloverina cf. vestifex)]
MSLRRFLAALQARNLEFLRDRTALGWNFIMPVLIVMGFAFAFSTGEQDLYKVALFGQAQDDAQLQTFLETRYIDFIPVDNLENAIAKVDRHQLDLLGKL